MLSGKNRVLAGFAFILFLCSKRSTHTYTKLNPNLPVVFPKRTSPFSAVLQRAQSVCGLSDLPAPWRQ